MSDHDVVTFTAAALHERALYILEHGAAIYVREVVDGRAGTFGLFELPPSLAIAHAFRFLLRSDIPYEAPKAMPGATEKL
jgi:hypothetical protein